MSEVKILIVEDESIVAMDIKHRAEGLGYLVTAITPSGEEALEHVAENTPDLVLMDIVLKGEMDGIEAAQKIRDAYDIPVVYLTAYSDERTLKRAKITEPFGYIIKPFEDRELHSAVEVALYKHQMESKLKESEKWLSTTLESIGDAVIATDKDGKLKFMNPVASQITGWDHDAAIGQPLNEVFNIINEESGVAIDDPVAKVVENDAIIDLPPQVCLINKNGEKVPIDDSSAPIKDENGGIIGVALVFRDVTQRRREAKEREELLKDKARGELSSFMVSALPVFASNIPPQIRNNIARSFADRFEKNMKPMFMEEMEKCQMNKGVNTADHTQIYEESLFQCYLSWISEFMSNLGIDTNTEVHMDSAKSYLNFGNCPWTNESGVSPIFCLICRAIVIRSFTWTSLRGHVEQSQCLLDGDKQCSFEFIISWNPGK
ncbi:GGDEF domain-containing response regulator [Methanobacterium ferruginis]|uniref:GGDEF domain-containing response regulator n=1 Tax=Methanobacterium ferruginis TaxID=710191 RepID=UPI0025742C3E|nr:GGDEF domain-containing response regulator [Methanobacterium ferruginis]BDZ68426.1 sensory transduction regulatory protein [Methanobacterium ferruginis]